MLPPDPDIVEDMLLKSRVYQAVIIMYAQQRSMDKCLSFVRKSMREGLGASPQTLQVGAPPTSTTISATRSSAAHSPHAEIAGPL